MTDKTLSTFNDYETGNRTVSEDIFVTPENYGAVGDGNMDDSDAIQAALDASRKVKFVPGKTYYIGKSLHVDSDQIVDLNGATIYIDGNYPAFISLGTGAIQNAVIKNGNITGTADPDGNNIETLLEQRGIVIAGYRCKYYDLTFRKLAEGIRLRGRESNPKNLTLIENRIMNCKFAACLKYGIHVENGSKNSDGFLTNILVSGTNFECGIHLGQANGWQVSGVHIYGIGDTHMCVRNTGSTHLTNIEIEGGYTNIGLDIYGYSSCALSNCTITASNPNVKMLRYSEMNNNEYPLKPLVASNIIFKTQLEAGSEIIPVSGYGHITLERLTLVGAPDAFIPSTNPNMVVTDPLYNIDSIVDAVIEELPSYDLEVF